MPSVLTVYISTPLELPSLVRDCICPSIGRLITQHRYIDNNYELFANNTEKPTTNRNFKGHSLAPFFPSVQAAYNWHRFSFQANAGVGGGGGKCTFDDGLGSFEKIVSETALAASGLASTVDGSLFNALTGARVPEQMAQAMVGKNGFSSDQYFGKQGKYSAQSYMRGRQYYYGVSLGVGYKLTDDLSVFAGARGVYASCNYYGYVRNIKVGNMPLYQVLDPTKTNSADIELRFATRAALASRLSSVSTIGSGNGTSRQSMSSRPACA